MLHALSTTEKRLACGSQMVMAEEGCHANTATGDGFELRMESGNGPLRAVRSEPSHRPPMADRRPGRERDPGQPGVLRAIGGDQGPRREGVGRGLAGTDGSVTSTSHGGSQGRDTAAGPEAPDAVTQGVPWARHRGGRRRSKVVRGTGGNIPVAFSQPVKEAGSGWGADAPRAGQSKQCAPCV